MASAKSKRLVIDACIAYSAGEISQHPISKYCRKLLSSVLDICYQVVMTSQISKEWKENASKFSTKWLRRMTARKKVCRIHIRENSDLRKKIMKIVLTPTTQEAMLKDMLLIEAALSTDKIILSLDQIGEHFAEISQSIGEIKEIHWSNPADPNEQVIPWLEQGAPMIKERTLGFKQS